MQNPTVGGTFHIDKMHNNSDTTFTHRGANMSDAKLSTATAQA